GGVVLIPGVTKTLEEFLHPTFADSKYVDLVPSETTEWTFAAIGAVVSLAGIGLAYMIWIKRPGLTARLIERFPRVHGFLENKWYWGELYDLGVIPPVSAL